MYIYYQKPKPVVKNIIRMWVAVFNICPPTAQFGIKCILKKRKENVGGGNEEKEGGGLIFANTGSVS